MTTLSPIRKKGMMSAMVALGFYIVGMLCLLACLAVLAVFPRVLSGDPYRLEVIALAALAIPGFAGSSIFGTFYAVSSLLSGSSLWSRPLAVVHLALHVMGMCGMILALGGMPFLEQPFLGIGAGAVLQLLGVLLLLVNLIVTTSQLNRWEPEQITVMLALFWLGIAALLGLGLFAHIRYPIFQETPLRLMEVYAHLSLAGFLWLGMLGTSLKLFGIFLVGGPKPGGLSWTGCAVINVALMAMAVLPLSFPWTAHAIPAGMIFAGSLLYLADIRRIAVRAKEGWTPGLTVALAGLAAGILLIGWVAGILAGWLGSGTLEGEILRKQARAYVSLAILGTVLMISLGMGTRLVPFLVWRLRCLPLATDGAAPTVNELADTRGSLVFPLCLIAGWTYLAAGQWAGQAVATQLGVLCLLVGIGWFFAVIRPAAEVFLFGAMREAGKNDSPASVRARKS